MKAKSIFFVLALGAAASDATTIVASSTSAACGPGLQGAAQSGPDTLITLPRRRMLDRDLNMVRSALYQRVATWRSRVEGTPEALPAPDKLTRLVFGTAAYGTSLPLAEWGDQATGRYYYEISQVPHGPVGGETRPSWERLRAHRLGDLAQALERGVAPVLPAWLRASLTETVLLHHGLQLLGFLHTEIPPLTRYVLGPTSERTLAIRVQALLREQFDGHQLPLRMGMAPELIHPVSVAFHAVSPPWIAPPELVRVVASALVFADAAPRRGPYPNEEMVAAYGPYYIRAWERLRDEHGIVSRAYLADSNHARWAEQMRSILSRLTAAREVWVRGFMRERVFPGTDTFF